MAGRKGRLPAPPIIADYLGLSAAAILHIPAGRWAEADTILAGLDPATLSATSVLVWRPAVGGLACRRGDRRTADGSLDGLGQLALGSEEPQRIIPMACGVLPWLFVADRHEELRTTTEDVLEALEGRRPAVLSAHGVVRTLAAAGEWGLLASVEEALRQAPGEAEAGRRGVSLLAAEGLAALATGRPEEAVSRLSTAISRDDQMGFAYDAACLRLDLARALEDLGEGAAAAGIRREAESILPLGCLNPF